MLVTFWYNLNFSGIADIGDPVKILKNAQNINFMFLYDSDSLSELPPTVTLNRNSLTGVQLLRLFN